MGSWRTERFVPLLPPRSLTWCGGNGSSEACRANKCAQRRLRGCVTFSRGQTILSNTPQVALERTRT